MGFPFWVRFYVDIRSLFGYVSVNELVTVYFLGKKKTETVIKYFFLPFQIVSKYVQTKYA